MAKAKLVTGLFKNRMVAEAAVDAIMKRGYTRDDISVMMSDATQSKEFALQARTHAADGAGIGGAVGGVVGAVLAAIVAVGIRNTARKFTRQDYAAAEFSWELKLSRTRKLINSRNCSKPSAVNTCGRSNALPSFC